MLAYVFWHWPRTGATPADYEDGLRRFHSSLSEPAIPGFYGSACFACPSAPWRAAPPAGAVADPDATTAVYEDWYLVDGFGALGTLNEAAVDAARRVGHDRVAADAAGGTAGVYRLSVPGVAPGDGTDGIGPGLLAAVPWAVWFAKPEGLPYGDLHQAVERAAASGGPHLLAQRQMTLGPGPEFCLRAPVEPELPVPVEISAPSRTVWPLG